MQLSGNSNICKMENALAAKHVDYMLMQFGVQTELDMVVCFKWQSQVRVKKGTQLPMENAEEDGGKGESYQLLII